MLQVQVTLDTPAMFMAVILITLLGMVLYGIVLGLGALAGGQGREAQLMEPFIHLRGVTKIYRRGKAEHLAISDATFDVMPGELVSLVGPSGCGKSHAAQDPGRPAPARRRQSKRIGSAAHSFDPSRDVGMVFQAPLLLKWRRILENVLLPAEILGLPMGEARERAQRPARHGRASPATRTSTRTSSPAACSSAPLSRARWCTTRSWC